VCRASDVFIVGEMNFGKGKKRCEGVIQMITRANIRKDPIFNANWDRRSPQSLPQTRGSIVPLSLRHFGIHREDRDQQALCGSEDASEIER
jgi:hypothetical protein